MLLEAIRRIDAGECGSMTDDELAIVSGIINGNTVMSREEAAEHLGMNLRKFHRLQQDGVIPEGHRRRGFKEKVYYKKEMDRLKGIIRTTP